MHTWEKTGKASSFIDILHSVANESSSLVNSDLPLHSQSLKWTERVARISYSSRLPTVTQLKVLSSSHLKQQ